MLNINSSSLLSRITPGKPSQATVTIVDNECKQFLNYNGCINFIIHVVYILIHKHIDPPWLKWILMFLDAYKILSMKIS